jgi:hypothetical protein
MGRKLAGHIICLRVYLLIFFGGMMKTRNRLATVILVFVLLLVFFTGCDPGQDKTSGIKTSKTVIPPVDAWYQSTVGAIKELQQSELPDNLLKGESIKTGGEFDINQYFSVLTHLKLEEGYTLDWVYDYNGSAGVPRLYVRPVTQKPYEKNYPDFYEAKVSANITEDTLNILPLVTDGVNGDSGNKIRIDGTKEGFFEYAVLQTIGDQFYQFWHAAIHDTVIICSREKLEAVIKEGMNTDFGFKMTEETAEKARDTDFTPYIVFSDDRVRVSILTFSKWSGFERLEYTINREYPYTIVNTKSEVLVEYHCGVVF